ncbi:uncharacterized protein LOC142238596 [Haematobia irritans]|uniref:uncharacterized protein LOC142238596 n=1 Tax=Haematobia irritans TaxID=7368 RepID=UPI003F4FB743
MGWCDLKSVSLLMAWIMLIYSILLLIHELLNYKIEDDYVTIYTRNLLLEEDFMPGSMKPIICAESGIMCAVLIVLLVGIYKKLYKLIGVYISVSLVLKTIVLLAVIITFLTSKRSLDGLQYKLLFVYCITAFALYLVMSFPMTLLYRKMRKASVNPSSKEIFYSEMDSSKETENP